VTIANTKETNTRDITGSLFNNEKSEHRGRQKIKVQSEAKNIFTTTNPDF
jgi:hypothetical protein